MVDSINLSLPFLCLTFLFPSLYLLSLPSSFFLSLPFFVLPLSDSLLFSCPLCKAFLSILPHLSPSLILCLTPLSPSLTLSFYLLPHFFCPFSTVFLSLSLSYLLFLLGSTSILSSSLCLTSSFSFSLLLIALPPLSPSLYLSSVLPPLSLSLYLSTVLPPLSPSLYLSPFLGPSPCHACPLAF